MTTLTRSQIGDIIMSKLHSIAPDAPAISIHATLHDIHQSCYWSADISIARLAAIYNGAAGLASREQTELILNKLEDEDIAAYIAARATNPSPVEPVAPDAFDELALEAYYQERDALEDLVNLSPADRLLPERDMDGSYFQEEPSAEQEAAALAWNIYLDSLPEYARLAAQYGDLDSEACAGCGALPGDGITASCWHSTGCGYLRELEQRLAERDQ
jgi:hypothetical protein